MRQTIGGSAEHSALTAGRVVYPPFKRHTETVVKLSRETPWSRRLNADIEEEAKVLAACDTHLRLSLP